MSSIIRDWHRQQQDRKYKALFASFVIEEYTTIIDHGFGIEWRFSMAFFQAAYVFARCCFSFDVNKHCEISEGAITPRLTAKEVKPLLDWYVGSKPLPEKFMTDKLARDIDYYLNKHCSNIQEQKLTEKFAYIEIHRLDFQ